MIDEQRFDPFSEKQEKGDELLKRSLILVRKAAKSPLAKPYPEKS